MYNKKDTKSIQAAEFKACSCGWQKALIMLSPLQLSLAIKTTLQTLWSSSLRSMLMWY